MHIFVRKPLGYKITFGPVASDGIRVISRSLSYGPEVRTMTGLSEERTLTLFPNQAPVVAFIPAPPGAFLLVTFKKFFYPSVADDASQEDRERAEKTARFLGYIVPVEDTNRLMIDDNIPPVM